MTVTVEPLVADLVDEVVEVEEEVDEVEEADVSEEVAAPFVVLV